MSSSESTFNCIVVDYDCSIAIGKIYTTTEFRRLIQNTLMQRVRWFGQNDNITITANKITILITFYSEKYHSISDEIDPEDTKDFYTHSLIQRDVGERVLSTNTYKLSIEDLSYEVLFRMQQFCLQNPDQDNIFEFNYFSECDKSRDSNDYYRTIKIQK